MPRAPGLLAATLGLACASRPASAVCTVNLVSPAAGSTLVNSPLVQWTALGCSTSRVQYAADAAFATARFTSPYRTGRSYRLNEALWEGHQLSDWSDGVYVRVQGRAPDGTVSVSTSRFYAMDPDIDDDGVSVGGGDCDDGEPLVHPGLAETCDDGLDNDCDPDSDAACARSGDLSLAVADTTLWGEDADDRAGSTVAIIPDLDGDGFDELLVGAPGDDEGAPDAGAVYLFYGPLAAGDIDLSAADAKILGAATNDGLGEVVGYGGDLDGDGLGEIVLSIDAYEGSDGLGPGSVYIWYGAVEGTLTLASADAIVHGDVIGDEYGFSMSAECDVNGDGATDLLAGGPDNDGNGRLSGGAWLVHGPILGEWTVTDLADGTWYGEAINETAGHAVACAGDLDGDGNDDLLIGGDENDAGGTDAGAVYVMYGPVAAGPIDLSALTADAMLLGENAGDGAGIYLSGRGDLDMDGLPDIVASAPLWDTVRTNSGRTYVVSGAVSGAVDLSTADAFLDGADSEQSGISLSSVGDLDGDGTADLVLGSIRSDLGAIDSGGAWVLYGPLSGERELSDADLRLAGEAAGDQAGWRVSSHGDLDGDGVDDLVVGARGVGADDAGAVYVLLGRGR